MDQRSNQQILSMSIKKTLLWITLFSIAMGFLETAVVVYLRELYYPDGFKLPLVNLDPLIAITELGREAATIIMLAGIGIIAGRTPTQRFAWFIYSFAIWDIFYYVFLKVLLNWPESLFTWDILFLIPLPWFGPVICPVIISLSMILFAGMLIHYNDRNSAITVNEKEWALLIIGSVVAILSFVIDCFNFIQAFPGEPLEAIAVYIPDKFDWWIFWCGQTLILTGIFMFFFRAKALSSRTH